MTRKKSNIMTFVVLAALVIGGLYLFGGRDFLSNIRVPTTPSDTTPGALDFTGICDTNNQKSIGWSLVNSLNSTSREVTGATVRVYKIVDGAETFYNTGTSASSPSTVALDCGASYSYYVAANSTYNSYKGTVDLATPEKVSAASRIIEVNYPTDWAALVFRVWDNDQSAFVCAQSVGDTGCSASSYRATGTTFTSDTSNSSNKSIGTGGTLNYRIEFKTNETSASDTSFTDKSLVVSYKGTDTDYDLTTAALTVSGATVAKTDCASIGSKLANDDFDVCWVVTSGSGPLIVSKGTVNSANFQISAVGGVNPNSDITLAWNSAGYYVKTQSSGMALGVNDDAPSPSYVHTQQTLVAATD